MGKLSISQSSIGFRICLGKVLGNVDQVEISMELKFLGYFLNDEFVLFLSFLTNALLLHK